MSKILIVDNRLQSEGCAYDCGECRLCLEAGWENSRYWAEVKSLKEALRAERQANPPPIEYDDDMPF